MSTRKRTAHYVVSTHWDREWYESFQSYRFRLVNLIDELLDTMEVEPEFRYFQMDGQAIPVEDYLAVRPEREQQVKAMAEAGRLRLGPWYVLPDEFLVSGESLVRNLQMGLAAASRFGAPSRVGFVCDLFGHISQLPQILRGFGIDNAFLWRGTNESTHGALWRWQSPDGSEVIAYRFSSQFGYCSYAFKVRRGQKPDEPVTIENALAGLDELVAFESARCPTSSFLLFDGGDHMEIEPQTQEILAKANTHSKSVEIVHSHLDGFVEDLREQRDRITRTFVGELRDPGEVGDEAWVIPGVLSSRVHLKQANARCEAELCLWAEPFSTFASTVGAATPPGYLNLAWRYLLQNHPHDSICGCSIDQVHKDMEYRFDQSLGLASLVTRSSLQAIAARVQLPKMEPGDRALLVFNPSSEPLDGPVDVTIRFPSNIDAIYQEFFGFEPKVGFRLYDSDGRELPYQYVAHRLNRQTFRRNLRKFPAAEQHHEVDVSVSLRVPAYGYATVICRPMKEPTRHLGSMLVDDHTIENDALRVSAGPNGTITLTDKRAGQTYEGLLTLEDRADIGDGWYHGLAANDEIHSSVAAAAQVAVVDDGIARATLKIRVEMPVPQRFEFDRMVRSADVRPLVVTHFVTLPRGADSVDVRTVVENTVRDHRLRLLFPTNVNATTYLADQAFDVVERPIALREDNARYKELEIETRPQQTWTAVHGDKRGLAIVSPGLYESAVRDLPARPVALTLLRSFIKAVLTPGNEGGQIQGRHEFHYRIVPLQGRPDVSRLSRMGQQIAAGVRVVQLDERDLANEPAGRRRLPAVHSFLRVESPAIIVSAVHHHGEREAATIRMFNPTDGESPVAVHMAAGTGQARYTDLEGKPGDPVPTGDGAARFTVPPKKIVTVQLT